MTVIDSTGDLPVLAEGSHTVDPINGERFHVFSTLPQDTDERRIKVLSILEGESLTGGDMIGSVISYSDYIIYPVQLAGKEPGEVIPALRTLVLGPDHPPVAFVSKGVLQSLQRIANSFTRLPPYEPPLQVKIVKVPTKQGWRMIKLIVQDKKE